MTEPIVDTSQLLLEKAQLMKRLDAQDYVLNTLADVFREFGVCGSATSSAECLQALRDRLTSAEAVYAVMRGERKASEILAEMEKLSPPEIFTANVVDLAAFLAPRLQKFVEELAGKGPKSGACLNAAMLASGLKAWETHRPIFERRLLTVQQLQRKCRELCESAGITDENEKQMIESEISAAVGADVLALSQVEAGDFSEVERLFAARERQHQRLIQ